MDLKNLNWTCSPCHQYPRTLALSQYEANPGLFQRPCLPLYDLNLRHPYPAVQCMVQFKSVVVNLINPITSFQGHQLCLTVTQILEKAHCLFSSTITLTKGCAFYTFILQPSVAKSALIQTFEVNNFNKFEKYD